MKCEKMTPEEYYGVGNVFSHHSPAQLYCELESDDKDDIVETLKEMAEVFVIEPDMYNKEIEIKLYCDYCDEYIEFQIVPNDWLVEEEWEKLFDPNDWEEFWNEIEKENK